MVRPGCTRRGMPALGRATPTTSALVLDELDRVGATQPAQRTARFRCVLVLRSPAGDELVAEGTVEGRIAASPVGASGFGYDPVFVPEGAGGRTFAEMDAGEKHAISHRGRALASLVGAAHRLSWATPSR